MSDRILVVGATGRTGRHVIAAAAARGVTPVALAREESRARGLLPGIDIVVGDLEDPVSLTAAVRGVNGVVFVHGSDGDSRADSVQRIDYGGVVNVVRALGDRRPHLVLQTSIFVTRREHALNAGSQALDWKRRSERVVRRSGAPYTVVRPGWLDAGPEGVRVTLEQGDTGEGGIGRAVLATVLVEAFLRPAARGKTFEVYAGPGTATSDWDGLFALARTDVPAALDAVEDAANMPLEAEPERVRNDLAAVAIR